MSGTEENDKAVLSIVGALLDHLADARLIDRAALGVRIEHAAAAHDEAGEASVGDRIRWVAQALLNDEALNRLTRGASSLHQ